jgi:phage shock protein PspC (stress-responsive transcriptional regulator)
MKTTISINLSGILFNVDEDAYQALKRYLDKVKENLGSTSEAKETITDIEARMAEILSQKLTDKNQPVTYELMKEVISIIGEPEEIGGSANQGEKKKYRKVTYDYTIERRLYRDTSNKVLGGVCSGFGHYINVDPVIIRIAMVAAFLGFGAGFLIYIICWIAIPEAVTPEQKRQMRGEPSV